jgi:hypothetical protein
MTENLLRDKMERIKIGIDLDNTVTASEQSVCFFRLLTKHIFDCAEIHIITNREPGTEGAILRELQELGVRHHYLQITSAKAEYIKKNGITVFFEDTDEYFLDVDTKVCVFKIRENRNFHFEQSKWIGSHKTVKMID